MNSINKYKIRLSTFTNCNIYQSEYSIYHMALKWKIIVFPYFCLFFTYYHEHVLYIFVAIRYY